MISGSNDDIYLIKTWLLTSTTCFTISEGHRDAGTEEKEEEQETQELTP